MAGGHGREEAADLATDAVLVAADAADRGQPVRARVALGERLAGVDERADQAHAALARAGHGRQRGDAAVEQDVPEERLRAVVGGVAEGQRGAAERARRAVEGAPPVAAAHVAAVEDAAGHQVERRRVLADDPLDAEGADLGVEAADRRLELALLDRHRDEVVGERGAAAVGDEAVKEAEAVLPAGDPDGDAVARLEHLELAHRAADRVQDAVLDGAGFGGLSGRWGLSVRGRTGRLGLRARGCTRRLRHAAVDFSGVARWLRHPLSDLIYGHRFRDDLYREAPHLLDGARSRGCSGLAGDRMPRPSVRMTVAVL